MVEQGLKPYILCTDKTDEAFAFQINQSLRLDIYTPKEVDELFDLLKSVKVVAARMHGIIASLLSGNVVVGLNWQFKVKSLSEKQAINFPCFDFNLDNIEEISTCLSQQKINKGLGDGTSFLYQELNTELIKLIRL